MKMIRILFMLLVMVSSAFSDTPPVQVPSTTPIASSCSTNSIPSNTKILAYDCGDGSIQSALDVLGLTYTVRNASNPVTEDDLDYYDILIISWETTNNNGTSGLSSSVIENGINGRVILTGHDTDWHTANDDNYNDQYSAETFLTQCIEYIVDAPGTGLLAHGEANAAFEWLPEDWGIVPQGGIAEEQVTSFTEQGEDFGIFDGLDADDMSNWNQSFHNYFESWGYRFEPLELGRNSGNDVITIGTPKTIYSFRLSKEDDVEDGSCVSPADSDDNDITYTISWKNTTNYTLTDVTIIDYLPNGVDYPAGWDFIDSSFNIIEGDPNYDIENHTYTWAIDTLEPIAEDPNTLGEGWSSFTLDVVINEKATPGMNLHNEVKLIGSYYTETPDPNDPNNSTIITYYEDQVMDVASENTPVCCWDNSSIIYVSKNATGACTGLNWKDAYNTEYGLKMALNQTNASACSGPFTIYIAQGTYLPGTLSSESFDLPDDTEIYGGFPASGCDFGDRNPKKYVTTLSGLCEKGIANTVVTMGNDALLSGVTVTSGYDYNVYGNYFALKDCIIQNSIGHGVYSEYGDVSIKSCLIKNNGKDGIRQEGLSQTLNVSKSWVMRNNNHGIVCLNTTPTIVSTIVSESDMANEGKAGVYIDNPDSSPILHNVTIANNKSLALQFTDTAIITDPTDPNGFTMDYPDINSCIIYYNNKSEDDSYGDQISGMTINNVASYCCIQGCEANINNNINAIPEFAYEVDAAGEPDPENYHLAYNSVCIDKGDPSLIYDDQKDYDNESRVEGNYVDLGADEVYSCSGDYTEEDIYNEFDGNADGLVNMNEFQVFADSWLTYDPNDPEIINNTDPTTLHIWLERWNGHCNFDTSGDSEKCIDLADLEIFLEDYWLWEACWYENQVAETTTASTATASLLSANTSTMTTMAFTASTLSYVEDTSDEYESPYSGLTNSELAELVIGIYELEDAVQEQLDTGSEDSENLTEILDFFDDILLEIQDYLIETEE